MRASLHATNVETVITSEEGIALHSDGLETAVASMSRMCGNIGGKGANGASTETEKRKLHDKRANAMQKE